MNKRYLMMAAVLLFVVGISTILTGLFGGPDVSADGARLVLSESETLHSFLTFGGSMVGVSVVFFIILAYL